MIITLKIDINENKNNPMETVEGIRKAFQDATDGISKTYRNNGWIENAQGDVIGRWEIKWP